MSPKYATAFITGAASGIGLALAQKLAADGTKLFLSDIEAARLDQVVAGLRASGATVHACALDVSDRAAVEAAAAQAEAEIGPIDIVFNNAGVSMMNPIATTSYDDIEWLMNINFLGVVYGTKAFLPGMLERGRGRIVNTSSLFGLISVPGGAFYCASKHAVKGFTESLHYELLGTGVRAHNVHPGGVKTNIVLNGKHNNQPVGHASVADLQAGFEQVAITTPEDAAEQILDGVAAGRLRILVGPDARKYDRIQRHFPRLWLWLFARRYRKKG
ncbi:MAG: SDR family NAD(P)-dependent oxidoreductase [Alphaproteobacteria bacterium]|nr:MAG: SDR family NAD(P)-dependent oxidoreductase [Alphaproteobacteria bacterium]